jgi:lycopene beta-cyclase
MHVAIVGAGISALLLARSLIERTEARVTVVAPRRPQRPHLLSYWAAAPTPFDAHTAASWSTIAVIAEDRLIRRSLTRFRYQTFHAQAWAEEQLASLRRSGRVEFVETRVDAIEEDLVQPVVVAEGQRLIADWVFDSRSGGERPDRWQRFEGWELVFDHGHVDPSTATLLDFRTPQQLDFRFVYVLPLAERHLFVEHVSTAPCDHAAALKLYLREVLALHRWVIVDREDGATPLFGAQPPRGEGRVIRIGVAGGMAKTCTGYALMRMWRDAERIAHRLSQGRHPLGLPAPPSLYRVADLFYLDVLRTDPGKLERLMHALFSIASGDAVLAFLDEQASLREQLAVARAMPEWLAWAAAHLTPEG